MLSVIIPTLNSERTLAPTLAALVPAVVAGLVQEAIIVDGGSTDETCLIAKWAGTRVIEGERGGGDRLAAGVSAAKANWLLFLNPDAILDPGWAAEAEAFIDRIESGKRAQAAAVFRFALEQEGFVGRLRERVVGLRSVLLRRPSSEQGLLISRALYTRLIGSKPLAASGYDDLVRRLKRNQLAFLRSRAVTPGTPRGADRHVARGLRNLLASSLRLPARVLARLER